MEALSLNESLVLPSHLNLMYHQGTLENTHHVPHYSTLNIYVLGGACCWWPMVSTSYQWLGNIYQVTQLTRACLLVITWLVVFSPRSQTAAGLVSCLLRTLKLTQSCAERRYDNRPIGVETAFMFGSNWTNDNRGTIWVAWLVVPFIQCRDCAKCQRQILGNFWFAKCW